MAPDRRDQNDKETPQITSAKWQNWMDSIRLNKADDLHAILEDCDAEKADMLLNGRFDYLQSDISKTLRLYHPPRPYFTYPVTIAASYGAVDALIFLIDNGADPLIRESGGNNILHTLIDLGSAHAKAELRMASIYGRLTERLPTTVQRALLSMENASGLRPIEYAARKGCVLLVRSILETRDVYLTRRVDVGLDEYRWYDVTDYERPDRLSKCPLLLLTMSVEMTFVRDEFADFMRWPVVERWRRAKIRSAVPLLVVWFLVRLVYTVSHITIALDHLSPAEPAANGSDERCADTHTIRLSPNARTLLLYYGIVHSTCIVLYDVIELVTNLRTAARRPPTDRLAERFILLTHLAYRINQFLMAVGVTTLYAMYLAGWDGRSSSLRSALEIFTVFSVYISMAFFVLVVPYVGFQFIIVHQLVSQLFAFLVLYMLMLLPFSTFFMAFMNANSAQGCIEEFGDPLSSIYTSILIMLNMVDLTDFVTVQRGFLLLVHVVFVFVIGILMINFLIAIMTNRAGTLMERQNVMVDVYAAYLAITLEMRWSRLLRGYYSRTKRRHLLYENGRYYVIDVERLAGCTRADVSGDDGKET